MLVEEDFIFFQKNSIELFCVPGSGEEKEKPNFTCGASKYVKMWGMFLTEYASLCSKRAHRLINSQTLGIWGLIPGGLGQVTALTSTLNLCLGLDSPGEGRAQGCLREVCLLCSGEEGKTS